MNKITINGKTYISVYDHRPNGEYKGCVSCALYGTYDCAITLDNFNRCADIIWEQAPVTDQAEEKYTISDFIEALNNDYIMSDEQIGMVNQYLKQKYDPEYKEYLRLKKKFEK